MYLPTQGLSRDRTADFNSLKGTDKDIFIDRKDSDDASFLIQHDALRSRDAIESILEPFFQLARDTKAELQSLDTPFNSLLKAQQECLRPTFADANDQFATVNNLTNTITSQLKEINKKIGFLDTSNHSNQNFFNGQQYLSDRSRIIRNIRLALQEQYNEFNSKFKMSLQSFNANYNQNSDISNQDMQETIDYSTFNFGDNTNFSQERQMRQNNAQLEELGRRAAVVREIFQNLANLVVEQGTVIDRIDCNIATSLENAQAAHEDVEKAATYQKKSRMWLCVVFLAIFVLILIVMIIFK
ncbi:SNARE domain containing protein [Tritrichomonas foetus]|uniref:SNARE domain containing protein n=1 Tax=Tritrichomonas foetus TaxID=1144522 RepID=A0A1J4JIM5_9EUKA|nr:SNARE domain containing protein [Tritrichomonas foetus]|eukprot:OHS98537.1 SNARE domain containing protein [Tritrichomonas foetus]